MKLLIAIPSKNRVETFNKNVFPWLCELDYDWKVFVEPQDIEKYNTILALNKIIDIKENNKGLGYAKNFIKNYAIENGYDLILKLDDDVKGFTNLRIPFKNPLEASKNFNFLYKKILPMFENYERLGAVAFPYSNELYDLGSTFEKTKRLQTSYLIRTELFAVDPAINVFEDFATGLNLLVKNYALLKYNYAGQVLGVKVGAGTGGHQSYDRKEQAYKEVELLRKIYPALKFRKVDKPWEIEPDIRSIKL